MNASRSQPKPQQQPQQRQNENGNGQPKRPFSELKRFPLKAVIWENQTTNGPMFSVQLVRVYRDDQDKWQETHSLNADDLLAAGKLLNESDSVIQQELAERRQQSANERK